MVQQCGVEFAGVENATIAVIPTKEIPSNTMRQLAGIAVEAVAAQFAGGGGRQEHILAAQDYLRFDPMATKSDYVQSRLHPQSYVGRGDWWRDGQEIRPNTTSLLYDAAGILVGAVSVESNVSDSSPLGRGIKRLIPQTNWVRLRDGFTHPDFHTVRTDSEDPTVSALVVAGVREALRAAVLLPGHNLAAYVRRGWPEDAEREGLAQVLGLTLPPGTPPQLDNRYADVKYSGSVTAAGAQATRRLAFENPQVLQTIKVTHKVPDSH